MSKSKTTVAVSHMFKAYIDTINTHGGCAGRHPELVTEYVDRLMAERGLGVSASNEKGIYGLWSFWLNEKGIANLLSIPQLEKDGYTID